MAVGTHCLCPTSAVSSLVHLRPLSQCGSLCASMWCMWDKNDCHCALQVFELVLGDEGRALSLRSAASEDWSPREG